MNASLRRSCFLLLPVLLAAALLGCGRGSQHRVVVYCALDREFAEPILRDFEKHSGLEVVPRWDTEANKSVGLYEDLIREADRPRCDVHWNNEILATLRLHKKGLLLPYESPAAGPFPAAFKAKDHAWTAFAARARVFLINKDKLPDPKDWPRTWTALLDPPLHCSVAMARPQFGTTASQAAFFMQAWGDAKALGFFGQLKKTNLTVLPGNKQVAVAVGKGHFALGLTDTDDAMIELDQGKPVAIVFPEPAVFIPNTVAIIKGGPNPEGARKLIDYLLSPEVEAQLARSASRQIPLNPRVQVDLPKEVRRPEDLQLLAVDFAQAADLWEGTQKHMGQLFKQ